MPRKRKRRPDRVTTARFTEDCEIELRAFGVESEDIVTLTGSFPRGINDAELCAHLSSLFGCRVVMLPDTVKLDHVLPDALKKMGLGWLK